jgi:alpha-D-xyloside xylohydrolase
MDHITSFLQVDDNEKLMVAGNPERIHAQDGDVFIDVPFNEYSVNEVNGAVSLSRNDQALTVLQALRVRAYGDDCLRVSLLPGGQRAEDSPMICSGTMPPKVDLAVVETDEGYDIVDGDNRRRAKINCREIATKHWSDLLPAREKFLEVEWLPDGEVSVPFKSYDMFAHGVCDSLPLAYVERNGEVVRTTFSFEAYGNECFAGTGERFAKMDLAGQTITLENTDGLGVNSKRTYKNIPFYMSNRPYGLFVHSCSKVHLSFVDISTRSAQGLLEDDTLDMFIIGGGKLQNIIRNYCCITGFSPQLPLWSYGIWMSRMTYFSAEEILTIAQRLRSEDFPCDVLHIDTGWFEKDWVCEWKFSQERFSQPEDFMNELKDMGYRATLWQTPDISEESDVAPIAKEQGYLPKANGTGEAGSDFSMQQICGPIDFSNPDACNWYKDELLKPLLKMGAAAIKTDFGENIPMQAEYHSLPASKLRNCYALLYQHAAFEATREFYGEGNALVWARAGWAGCQRYPLHWGGDAESSWEGMAGSLKGGLHLGLSGFTYWSHDVPGFHGTPDFMNTWPSDELYVRWTQFGVFSSHFRYHGTSPREPYEYPNVSDIVRSWWKLRYALIPYIVEQAEIASETGMPLLRALVMEDEKDPTCWHIDDQYMFGDAFMVAPVMNDRGCRDVYLPAGEWVDFWTGECLAGRRWLRDVQSPLSRMPVYVRHGAKVPIYPEKVACTDEMKPEHINKITIQEGFRGIAVCSELWMNSLNGTKVNI